MELEKLPKMAQNWTSKIKIFIPHFPEHIQTMIDSFQVLGQDVALTTTQNDDGGTSIKNTGAAAIQ